MFVLPLLQYAGESGQKFIHAFSRREADGPGILFIGMPSPERIPGVYNIFRADHVRFIQQVKRSLRFVQRFDSIRNTYRAIRRHNVR